MKTLTLTAGNRLTEWRGSLPCTFSKLRNAKALSFSKQESPQ